MCMKFVTGRLSIEIGLPFGRSARLSTVRSGLPSTGANGPAGAGS
jgi:hypothetical protein